MVDPVTEGNIRTAPLTWAQEHYWYIYAVPLPTVDSPKIGPVFSVGGATLAEVSQSVDRLVEIFESLRTIFPVGPEGVPEQVVCPPEPVALTVVEGRGDDAVPGLIKQLVEGPMDPTRDWPLRAGVVVHDGAPRSLVLVLNHIACDAQGVEVLRRILADLIAGRQADTDASPSLLVQPVDDARHLESAKMQRYHAKTFGHWRAQLVSAPGVIFPQFRPLAEKAGPREGDAGTYARCRLTADGLRPVLMALAERERAGYAVLLNLAVGISVSALSGNPRTAVQLNAANRDRDNMHSVGCYFQPTLLLLDLPPEASLRNVLRKAAAGSLLAYRHARYSYFAMRQERSRIARERGVDFRLAVTADVRVAPTPGGTLPWGERGIQTSFEVLECDWYDDYNDFYIETTGYGPALVFELFIHRSIGGEATAERLLRSIAELLNRWWCDAEVADLAIGEVQRLFEFPTTTYGDGWSYVDHSWVNTERMTHAVRDLPGVLSAEICGVRPDGRAGLFVSVTAACSECVTVEVVRGRLWLLLAHHADVVVPFEIAVSVETGATHECVEASDPGLGALCEALLGVITGQTGADNALSYVELGGTTADTRRVVDALEARGLAGLTPEDLLSPLPVYVLAAKLSALRAACQGSDAR